MDLCKLGIVVQGLVRGCPNISSIACCSLLVELCSRSVIEFGYHGNKKSYVFARFYFDRGGFRAIKKWVKTLFRARRNNSAGLR